MALCKFSCVSYRHVKGVLKNGHFILVRGVLTYHLPGAVMEVQCSNMRTCA
jgi:hypothetical protein